MLPTRARGQTAPRLACSTSCRPGPRRGLPVLLLGLAVLLPAALLSACGGAEDTYEITDVRRRPPPPAPPAPPAPERPSWSYALPAGWEVLPDRPMRDLGFRVAGNGEAECTLGRAGGGLLANLNRWRRQMGLPDLAESEAAALPRRPWLGVEAVLVELEGTYAGMGGGMGGGASLRGAKMLGLALAGPAGGLFLKMVGPAAVVDAERERFLALADSITPSAAPPAAPAPEPTPGTEPGLPPEHPPVGEAPALTWTAPEGWVKQPDRPAREVTFVPAGAKKAQCYVSILGGRAGGLDGNLNRWRGQMRQRPLSPTEIAALPRIDSRAGRGVLVEIEGEYAGDGGERVENAALLGLVVEREGDWVFVKMIGPADEVLPERERFEAFCRSLGG